MWNGVILNLISLMRSSDPDRDQYPIRQSFVNIFQTLSLILVLLSFFTPFHLHTHPSRNRSSYEEFLLKIRAYILFDS
ncbi:hypothetical protein LEP1GSC125_1294 [Leptospira mayottensis 200901122]|uniref:Uncharacterized protein n=2 Tax=Leptospira mayottensis TaxID=1137606 RepID=A0AA87SUV6_9LEPT|nr:hypothetical protein DQM28_11275 [Leptospira mayottensis]AXR68412.1 hypothetical protein DPV73_10660 [Leptospira mayottensis]EKR98334.1 hypothetical protein LEP1GSC125_1294 [Leptospira mayottensis 200901122]